MTKTTNATALKAPSPSPSPVAACLPNQSAIDAPSGRVMTYAAGDELGVLEQAVLVDAAPAQFEQLHALVAIGRAIGEGGEHVEARGDPGSPWAALDEDGAGLHFKVGKQPERLDEPLANCLRPSPLSAEAMLAREREHRVGGELTGEGVELTAAEQRESLAYLGAYEGVIHGRLRGYPRRDLLTIASEHELATVIRAPRAHPRAPGFRPSAGPRARSTLRG